MLTQFLPEKRLGYSITVTRLIMNTLICALGGLLIPISTVKISSSADKMSQKPLNAIEYQENKNSQY